MRVKRVLLISLHIATFFLTLMVVLSFITIRSLTLKLPLGVALPLSEISSRLGIQRAQKYSNKKIVLTKFEKNSISTQRRDVLNYKSYLTIIDGSTDIQTIIRVNHPLRYKGIKFYQQDWSFTIHDFEFSFNNIDYNLKQDKDKLILVDSDHFFIFYPMDMRGTEIIYEWQILNMQDEIRDRGYFTTNSLAQDHNLVRNFNFKITKSEVYPLTILQVSYKPYNIPLAVAAILFMATLVLYFIHKKIKITRDNNE